MPRDELSSSQLQKVGLLPGHYLVFSLPLGPRHCVSVTLLFLWDLNQTHRLCFCVQVENGDLGF